MTYFVTAKKLMDHAKIIRQKWECTQCGSCCRDFKIGLKKDDWERWENVTVDSKLGKHPMRKFCNRESKEYSKLGDLFFHPVSGEKLSECPFINIKNDKYYCMINDPKIKPTICKEFNEIFIDLRCKQVRKIINEMFNLSFKTEENEKIFYKVIDPTFVKLQQSALMFKGIYDIIKIISEEKTQ